MVPIAFFAAAMSLVLDRRHDITLAAPIIRIGDVVPQAGAKFAAVEIARLRSGQTSITLSRGALAALIRRALPGISIDSGSAAGSVTLHVVARPASPSSCFVTATAVDMGAVIDGRDVLTAPCAKAAPPARYDGRRHMMIATRRLEKGDVVGRARPFAAPDIAAGEPVTLRTAVGPISIERRVTSLQPARAGGRVFVQDATGKVFAAPVAGSSK